MLIGALLPMQPHFQSNKPSINLVKNQIVPSNQWYIARIFQIWSAPIGYEKLAGGFKKIRNGKIF